MTSFTLSDDGKPIELPAEAEEEPVVSVQDLVTRAAHPKVVGIGETGLDYYYDNSPRDQQAASFRTHIAAARETGLPLIVHTRDADDDMADTRLQVVQITGEAQNSHNFRGNGNIKAIAA